MPRSMGRLSAGRESMTDEAQALGFLAGANSIFYGPKLLTTPNAAESQDMRLLDQLGMHPMPYMRLAQRRGWDDIPGHVLCREGTVRHPAG